MKYQTSNEGEAKRPVMLAFAVFLFKPLLFLAAAVHLGVNCDSSIMPSYVWNVRMVLQQEAKMVLRKGKTS